MKILFITDLYPVNAEEITTPVTLHNFVKSWIKLGNQVDVIKPNFILNSFLRKKPFYKDGLYEYDGVNLYNVNYFTPFCFDITDKLNEFDFSQYDIIVAHMPSGIVFANRLNKKLNKPMVCGVHVSDIEVLTNPIYSLYFKNIMIDSYKNAKKIACRSEVLKKKFLKLLPELEDKVFVAPSGIDENVIQQVDTKFKSEKFKVLTCANFIKRKNIDKLILAMDGLENFELEVIGSGKEEKNLKELANLVDSDIKFSGRLANDKVLEKMKNSDIFILPSVNETFGVVYLEAMASGCITVCSKNDGVDGIIKDCENGFLANPSEDGIRDVLLKIEHFENKDEIVNASYCTAKAYSMENCGKSYLENIAVFAL